MKNISKYIMIAGMAAVLLNACTKDENKDSYGLAKVTTHPEIYLVDEEKVTMVLAGSQYVEPGYSAFIGEDDITNDVKVTGSVDVNVAGMYYLTYSATNVDGYSLSKSRSVFVAEEISNPTTDNLSGDYTSSVSRNNNGTIAGQDPHTQTISGNNGIYHIPDLLGGWYWLGVGYGVAYAYEGVVSVDADGVATLIWMNPSRGWGDGAVLVDAEGNPSTGVYDADAGKITFSAQMGSVKTMTFNVTLVKQ